MFRGKTLEVLAESWVFVFALELREDRAAEAQREGQPRDGYCFSGVPSRFRHYLGALTLAFLAN